MKVFLSSLAEYKLTKLLIYLEEEWGKPSKEKFLKKLRKNSPKFPVTPGAIPKQKILMTFIGMSLPPKTHFITGSQKRKLKLLRLPTIGRIPIELFRK